MLALPGRAQLLPQGVLVVYIGGAASWRPRNVANPHQGLVLHSWNSKGADISKVTKLPWLTFPCFLHCDLSVSSVVNQENKKGSSHTCPLWCRCTHHALPPHFRHQSFFFPSLPGLWLGRCPSHLGSSHFLSNGALFALASMLFLSLVGNPEGSTTSISAVATVSTCHVDDPRAAHVGKGSGKMGGHPGVVRKSPNPNKQDAQIRVTKLEAAIQAVGEDDPAAMGLKEALQKARIQAQLRPVQDRISHTEAFLNWSRKRLETMMSEARKLREDITELESKIQGWRTPFRRIKNRSQRSAVSICHCDKSSGGDPSASRKDCRNGSQWCQGWVFEATENVGQFVPRVGAFGFNDTRWGVDGESHPSSRRVHEERMSIFKCLRDAQGSPSG